MPQSLAQVWLHVIFSTKDRRHYLYDRGFRNEMFRMLAYNVKELNCVSATVGGFIDHVHLLVGLSRTITIAKFIEQVKIQTSRWAKDAIGGHHTFSWQNGYGAFSVSHDARDAVAAYIRDQEEHHSTLTFQEEYRQICRDHHVEIDERYVWD